jgi:hypothetical protein
MNLQESIRRILREVRVPRDERVQLYKDDNIIVVVPLTHSALQKYAHRCQWCINDDKSEWEDYHQGNHAVIIQRNPKKIKIGITGNPTASEILILERWDNGHYKFRDVCDILGYEFKDEIEMGNYYINVSNDINNFATNIVYYSPENGLYDMEDNYLWNFNIEINDIPNVKPEVIEIMDDYLQENEETQIQESVKKTLREERTIPTYIKRRMRCFEDFINKLMSGEIDEPIFRRRYNRTTFRIVLSMYMTDYCDNGGGDNRYNPIITDEIMELYGEKLYKWYLNHLNS